MNSMHPIIERISEDFPLFIKKKADFDLIKFLNKTTSLTQKGTIKMK